MRKEFDENNGRRIFLFVIIIIVLFSVLFIRLFYLQIIKGSEYQLQASKNSLKLRVIPTLRGKIYDKNGVLLATNKVGYKLIHTDTPYISKEEYLFLKNEKDDTNSLFDSKVDNSSFNKLSKNKLKILFQDINDIVSLTKFTYSDILQLFYTKAPDGSDRQIVVDYDIPVNEALLKIENITNPRINIVEYDKRFYPNNEIASHIVGYVKDISEDEYQKYKDLGYERDDIVGKKSIEKEYDELMHGKYGSEYVEVDAKGNVVDRIPDIAPVKGANLYLSIDERLQKYMTDQFEGKYGVFIAIEVKTGKILTMVSSPEINLNLLSSKISVKDWNALITSKDIPLVNKAIAGLFPPGSTFKPISAAAILDGGIPPTDSIYSTGTYRYANTIFRDSHRNGHGYTNFFKSIEESVNTYYYHFIQQIDQNKFFDIAKDFNIGQKTGIDLPNELSGILPTPEWKKKRFTNRENQIWYPGDLINMSIGQGFLLVTPLQIATVYQAIANNGILLQPELLDKIVYGDHVEQVKPIEVRKINVSEKTIKLIQQALTLPVKGKKGTAKILDLPFVNVSAKTGTAQNEGGDHSWMAGYFPSEKPQIAFVALVQEGGYGGVAAGQKVRSFIEKYYELYKNK